MGSITSSLFACVSFFAYEVDIRNRLDFFPRRRNQFVNGWLKWTHNESPPEVSLRAAFSYNITYSFGLKLSSMHHACALPCRMRNT